MPAPLLAIFASLSWGGADFLGGFTARRMSVLAVLAASQPAGLVLILGVFFWHGAGLPAGAALAWAVAAGFASVFSLGMLYLAMARGRMVLVAPLAATGVSLPVLFGLLSGDPITPTLVLGIVLAVLGTIAVTLGGESGDGERPDEAGTADDASRRAGRRRDLLAALCALGSAAGQGSFLTLLDHASNDTNPISATVAMRVTSCVLAVLLFLGYLAWRRFAPSGPSQDGDRDRTREPRPQPVPEYAAVSGAAVGACPSSPARPAAPTQARPTASAPRLISRALTLLALAVVGAGLADGLAEIAFASASSRGHLSVVAVLSEQYPTITMLLALTLLRERAKPLQYAGAVSALAGVLLLSLG